ncbi:MAG: PBP1A family penicillin-binding protein [Magnetococcales bacterium]|nr:PBP1A family penicillin-binding protein [Magnetococcales bacterium]
MARDVGERIEAMEQLLSQWRQADHDEIALIRDELKGLLARIDRIDAAWKLRPAQWQKEEALLRTTSDSRPLPPSDSLAMPQTTQRSSKRSWLLGCLVTLLTLILLTLLTLSGHRAFVELWARLPDREQIEVTSRSLQLIVKKEQGNIEEVAVVNTVPIPLDRLPPHVWQAFVAIEDQRFFTHGGLDPLGIFSSLFRSVIQGRRLGGGSTISQQTVKNLFFNPSRSLYRKIRESVLSLKLEHYFSKNEILQMYLNNAYFGDTVYGIEAAAQNYFSKHAYELNLMEAALLAGSVKGPNHYHPQRFPERSRARGRLVLEKMKQLGYIDDKALATARDGGVKKGGLTWQPIQHQYLRDWIIPELDRILGHKEGRFRVMTTLDPILQDEAHAALMGQLRKARSRQVHEGAILTLARDGAVLAMQGGVDFSESQLNRCTQAVRSPGSALKTFLYLTALEKGMTRETVLDDSPVEIDEWMPNNIDNEYLGEISLEQAFILSRNTVAVQVLQQLGLETYMGRLRQLGLERQMPANYTLALGTGEMTMLELATLYGILANDGYKVTPYAIHGILDMQGELLYWRQAPPAKRLVDPEPLARIRDLLARVVRSGTGRKAAFGKGSIHGKTGTSQNFRDAWFVGFTGERTTAVWLGNDDSTPMDDVTGGSLPAVIWKNYMEKVSH